MQKPNNYDQTPAGGDFTPVELGGHKIIIKQVSETKSKNGKDLFDPEYFSWCRKLWYKRIIDRLNDKVIDKSDIPFKEYRKFAYSKI